MPNQQPILLVVLLLVLLLVDLNLGADSEKCLNTPQCICKWSGGKKVADCSNGGFTSMPKTLKSDIQTLIMDGNPLGGLDKDAFKSVGLLNLQKISLQKCDLKYVDDNAFRDLKILVDLDLSRNNITKLKPKTFDGNDGLQAVKFSFNPIGTLVAYQFPPLRNLKVIDVSNCDLELVDPKAFHNLGASVESINLNNNKLKYLEVDSFIALQSLKNLHIHANPWVCDCKLKNFRDWLVRKGLYARPTACNEPTRLHDKMWDDISPGDFACKPEIIVPQKFVFGSPGVNVTLSCYVSGSPPPQVRWVVNGRIVNNNTSPAPFSDQKWIVREEPSSGDNMRRWYNLTVTNAGYDNLGDYLCVAENNGGVMERTVTLTFDDPSTLTNRGSGGGMSGDQLTVVVGATTAGIVFLGLMILLCCCCVCRKKKMEEKKNAKKGVENGKNLKENGSAISAYGNETSLMSTMTTRQTLDFQDESEALLLQHHMQHQRGSFNPMMTTPRALTNDSSNSSGVTPEPHYIPDLLEASTLTRAMSSPLNHNTMSQRKTSTPLSVVNLMQSSNSPGSASFHRSGTLPLPHHYHYHHNHSGHAGRSVSCDHTNSAKPVHHHHGRQMQQLPMVHYHHPLGHVIPVANNKHPRPGYVTLPRRPRASWSAPPPPQGLGPRDTPSPCSSQYAGRTEFREPIYDGVGPRTSADGSSKASLNTTTLPRNQHLNKSFDNSNFGVRTPLSSGPGNGYTLPPYYAPIEEVQECPPTPKERPRSTPNILDFSDAIINGKFNTNNSPQNSGKDSGPNSDLQNNNDSSVATSSSEITLIEENISGYCEPFGKAVLPQDTEEQDSRPVTLTPTRSSVATYSSAGSELELLIPQLKLDQQKSAQRQNQSPNSNVDAQIANSRNFLPQPAVRKQAPPQNGDQELAPKLNGDSRRKISPSLSGSSGGSTTPDQYRMMHSPNTGTPQGQNGPSPPQVYPKKSNGAEPSANQDGTLVSLSPNQLNNNHSSPNTSIDNSTQDDVARTSFNGNEETDFDTPTKKVPPKTLPKPKVRPVPPPKPKKSAIWVPPPLIGNTFQDEGADGSEV